jgi:transposase
VSGSRRRACGGFTTKLHNRCDGHGWPPGFALTPEQTHDVQRFGPLFRMLPGRIEALLADKAYVADVIHSQNAAAGAEAVIPAKSNRRIPIPHNREKYRWRNLVERIFSKFNNWQHIAARHENIRQSCIDFVAILYQLSLIFTHAPIGAVRWT